MSARVRLVSAAGARSDTWDSLKEVSRMHTLPYILAERLAPDSLWPVLVFLAALVAMASLKTMGNHIGEWRRRRPMGRVKD
jgi:hypothetical protein